MDLIEQELDAKTIEKLKEDAISDVIIEEKEEPSAPKPAPKKTKKVRSEAQKAAFEKARKKRAEKVAERKKLKEEESRSISGQVLHMLKKHDPQIAELEKQTGSADNRYQDTLE